MAKAKVALLKEEAPPDCAAEPLESPGIAIELQQAFAPIGHPLVGAGIGAGALELRVVTMGTTTMGITAKMPMVIAAPLLMW